MQFWRLDRAIVIDYFYVRVWIGENSYKFDVPFHKGSTLKLIENCDEVAVLRSSKSRLVITKVGYVPKVWIWKIPAEVFTYSRNNLVFIVSM